MYTYMYYVFLIRSDSNVSFQGDEEEVGKYVKSITIKITMSLDFLRYLYIYIYIYIYGIHQI